MSQRTLITTTAAFLALASATSLSRAQSLFERDGAEPAPAAQPAPAQTAPANGTPAPAANPAPAQPAAAPAQTAPAPRTDDPNAAARAAAAPLQGYSLMVVVPPAPKTYQKHDLVEIIINENSSLKFEQSLDTSKDYDLAAAIEELPSFRHLLEFQLEPGETVPLARAAANARKGFKGDGEAERKDRYTARISATVIDVKPNGNLVLEARKERQTDGETQTIVLAGVCRGQDITSSNTVQSSQIASMTLKVENTGALRDAAKKGIISKVLDGIFNF